jgi:hypothetical protein
MAGHPVPQQLDELGDRTFSFYPPIVNVEHNEWVFVRGTWSEILVRNPKLTVEIWIPRGYLGEISHVEEPVMIVGLRKELEFKGGGVWPYERRLVEMPRAGVAPRPAGSPGHEPTPPSALTLGSGAERRLGVFILTALGVAILATFLVILFLRKGESGGNVELRPILQSELGFTAATDYHDVVRRLGAPNADRWLAGAGERQYRALTYDRLNVTVILMGADREKAFYIGAKDRDWKNVHSVALPDGRNTDSILRSLKRF